MTVSGNQGLTDGPFDLATGEPVRCDGCRMTACVCAACAACNTEPCVCETASGVVTLPKLPQGRDDFEVALVWATSYFGVAEALDLGLDEGQQAILGSVVRRLDQLDTELRRGL